MNRRTGTQPLLSFFLVAMAMLLASGGSATGRRDLVLTKSTTPAGLPVYSGSHVLIVGINKYQNLPKGLQLRYAVNDATEMRDVLVDYYGFPSADVKVLTDEQATLANIRAALDEFSDKTRVKPNDRVLIYFSGHGQTVKDSAGIEHGYLIPCDAKVDLEDPKASEYDKTCLKMQEVWDKLDPSPAKHVAVIADACFSGQLIKPKSLSNDYALSAYLTMPARQAISAGGRGQKTWESDQYKHGVFTYTLLQELKRRAQEKQSVFPMVQLFAAIQDPVAEMSKGRQLPQFSQFYTEGQMLFFAGGTKPAVDVKPNTHPDDHPVEHNRSKPAKLIVKSKPDGATVTIDGEAAGTTPLVKQIDLDEKKKRVHVLVELAGYESVEKDLDLQQKKESRLEVKLKKSKAPEPPKARTARLTVTSDPPGATVFVDGVEKGVTPYTYELQLTEPRQVAIRVVLDGYEADEQQATLDPSNEGRVTANLRKISKPVETPTSPLKLSRISSITGASAAKEIHFSPDARQVVVVGDDSSLSIYDVASGSLVRSIAQPKDSYLRLTSDWKSLLFISLLSDGTRSWASILVQDMVNDSAGRVLSADMGRCDKLNYAWSDGNTAVICGQSSDGKATIASIDLASGKPLSFEASGRMTEAVVSTDGSILAAFREGASPGSGLAANLILLRGADRADQQEIEIRDSDMGASVMLAGDLVAINSGRRTSSTKAQSKGLRVFDARTGKPKFAMPARQALGFVSNDTRLLGWSSADGGVLELFDASTGASLGKIASPKLWLSPDGKFAASQAPDHTIELSSLELAK